MKTTWMWIALASSFLMPLGCREHNRMTVYHDSPPRDVVVVERPARPVVVERPAQTVIVERPARTEVVYVRTAPPPIRVEVRPARPSPAHVWASGYWDWQRTRHAWAPGRWAVPPHRSAVWVEHRWVHSPNGYHLEAGHWR